MNPILTASIIVALGVAIGVASRRWAHGRAPEVFLTLATLGLCGAISATFLGLAFNWSVEGVAGGLAAAIGAAGVVSLYHLVGNALWRDAAA